VSEWPENKIKERSGCITQYSTWFHAIHSSQQHTLEFNVIMTATLSQLL